MNEEILEILVEELGVDRNLAKGYLDIIAALSKKHHKLSLIAINNRVLTSTEEREMGYLEAQAKEAVRKISPKLFLYVNGDPRGNSFGLILPSGRSNNLGGEDWRLDAV